MTMTEEDNLNAKIMTSQTSHAKNVFLFVPNIIGYFRLALLLASWISHALSRPNLTLTFYIGVAILDFFDGFAARRLHQSSVFGAWFDVCIDVIARATMWYMVFSLTLVSTDLVSHVVIWRFPWGPLIGTLEWLAFVCNHATYGTRWKTRLIKSEALSAYDETTGHSRFQNDKDQDAPASSFSKSAPPAWVAKCFANGFISPLGVFAIAGVHCLPPWLYGCLADIPHSSGRELWFVYKALLEWNFVTLPFLISGRLFAACVESWIIWDHVMFLATQKED